MAATPVGARTITDFLVVALKYLNKVDFPVPAFPVTNRLSPPRSIRSNVIWNSSLISIFEISIAFSRTDWTVRDVRRGADEDDSGRAFRASLRELSGSVTRIISMETANRTIIIKKVNIGLSPYEWVLASASE